ncbi:F0F1 ATP synthase subunit delta [Teredinibacter turnerae]|uniref:F0F1 ATP synthase subunit delta n=1 Tax=Teredinibacter turnerae TaxID=2426 RepID=UPI0003683405|nr:F0F1 ATP synthase subunit delta [Teredinibacter turnerae]
MAELTTLARPYAKAAFEHALQAKSLEAWASALVTAAAVAQDDKVQALLSSPSFTSSAKAATFISLCTEELDESQQNFLTVLSENNRLPLLPEIASLFAAFKANYEKAVDVQVSSAYEIDDAVQEKLAASLSKKLDRQVSLHADVDTSLIGGAVVRAGDTVIDLSVKGKLAQLADAMIH